MCGLFASITQKKIDSEKVLTSLKRRGPDGHGHHESEVSISGRTRQLNLLHSRLSIVDPVSASNQPFNSQDDRYSIIFNGEIYNYIELRDELAKLGHHFKTKSDTEVLLISFIQWGEKCLEHLRGIFAFCIWDHAENSLFVARDHLGVKPLYLYHSGSELILSSTIDSILKSGVTASPVLNKMALNHYIHFGSFDGQHTLIDQIKSFPPGHYATIKNDQIYVSSYWNLQVPKTPLRIEYPEAISEIKSMMIDITKMQMRADVPVGAFLSGGIDSGMLVGLMSSYTDKPLHTFSIGFEDRQDLLEWELAKKSSEKFKTIHRQIKIDEKNFRESLDEFILALDHPSVDGLNSYLVSRETAKELKVAISGLGGDETFAGYYFYPKILKSAQSPSPLIWLGNFLPRSIARKGKLPFLTYPPSRLEEVLNEHRKIRPFGEGHVPTFPISYDENLFLSATTYHELNQYTVNTLLRDVDAVSMYNSLEVRVPFLDHHLVEFTLSLPDQFKVSSKYNKPLLIESFPDLLPKEVIAGPKKGFEMPIGVWISRAINEEIQSLPKKCQAIGIDPNVVEQSIEIFNQNPNQYVPVWRFIVLNRWLENHGITP